MARKRKRDDGGAPQTETDREEELFIQEVNEELKQERYLQTWKKYGQYIVGGALLAVGSVAGWQWYKDSIRSAQEAQSVDFASAAALAAGGKSGEAGKILDKLARETDGGYAALARLKQAALVGKSGDSKSAATLYLQLADDDRLSPVFRDLGTVLWGLHALDSAGPDQDDCAPGAACRRRRDLALHRARTDRPLSPQGWAEWRCCAYIQATGGRCGAPATLKRRAGEMLSMLGGS